MGEAAIRLEGGQKYTQDVETDLAMIIGQLNWFCDAIESDDDLNPSLVLRGMIRQLDKLIDPIADLERMARQGSITE